MAIVDHRKVAPGAYARYAGLMVGAKPLLQTWPVSDRGLRVLHRTNAAVWKRLRLPVDALVLGGQRTVRNRPRPKAARPAVADDVVVLYLHGGAFISGSPESHLRVTQMLADRLGVEVYSLDYRQLPGYGVGTSVADAVAAYRELLDREDVGRVVVAGDSAGGFLCCKVIEAARDQGFPRPAAYIGFSPFLDLAIGADRTRKSWSDAYLPIRRLRRLEPMFYRGPVEFSGVKSALELPGEIFPPTVLVSAMAEMLEPDMFTLTRRLENAGVAVQLHRFRAQPHAFPVAADLLTESRRAVGICVKFVRAALAADGSPEDIPVVDEPLAEGAVDGPVEAPQMSV